MTGEYKTAKGGRIFIYIFSPLFIGLFIYVGFITLNSEPSSLTGALIMMPVSLGGTILFTYGLVDTIKGRFIIGVNFISRRGIFRTRTLDFQDIKGFRADDHYIHIVSNRKDKKSIKATIYIEKSGQVLEWLSNNFLELDSHEAKQEEREILTDNEFGISEPTREYRLQEARRAAKYINIVGGVVCVWLWFYPQPYFIGMLVAIIIPVVAIGLVFIYKGLIRFNEKKNSAYPSIFFGITGPGCALSIRALMDYEILEYTNLWFVVSIATVFLTGFLILGTRELKFSMAIDYITALMFALAILSYTFGTYVASNCLFDKSVPEVFHSEVVDKDIGTGKTTTYYLVLKPWGPRTEIERVVVAREQYESTDKGEIVDIYLRQDFLIHPGFLSLRSKPGVW